MEELIFDKEDASFLSEYSWCISGSGYAHAHCRKTKKNILMHRLLMDFPVGKTVDHINGNRLDNRKVNLRVCTQGENNRNKNIQKIESKTSRYKGVSFCKSTGRWVSQISTDGKAKRIGRFTTQEAAAQAYNEMAKKTHGEFAKLNEVFGE